MEKTVKFTRYMYVNVVHSCSYRLKCYSRKIYIFLIRLSGKCIYLPEKIY